MIIYSYDVFMEESKLNSFCIDKAEILFHTVCTWRKNFKPELLQISDFAKDYEKKV